MLPPKTEIPRFNQSPVFIASNPQLLVLPLTLTYLGGSQMKAAPPAPTEAWQQVGV
jgi:hypothetical protein